MGWLSDFLQGIPVNAVLKERLALADQRFKDLESKIETLEDENKSLNDHVATLTSENEGLTEQLADMEMQRERQNDQPEVSNGLYYFGGDKSKPYCPRCYERERKKHAMAGIRHLGFQCTVCGNLIPR